MMQIDHGAENQVLKLMDHLAGCCNGQCPRSRKAKRLTEEIKNGNILVVKKEVK